MRQSRLSERVLGWLGQKFRSGRSEPLRRRGPLVHVVILDGTMSSLDPGQETHAGLTYKLCREAGPGVSVFYEAGVQWPSWTRTADVLMGRGINRQIRRAYGWLASRYRPGDTIFLLGYSRGAYAVRSLAGVIDRVGLLRAEHATERNTQTAYRHYEFSPDSRGAQAFRARFCHPETPIEMIGVWDTVKALGLRLPLVWRLYEARHSFHSPHLGNSIRHGFHALALDETRQVYEPILWECRDDWSGRKVEQVWFPGTHGDVGGQLGGFEDARPLANMSLVWMLEKAETCGLALPADWRARFPCDADAPSVGTWRGWGKLFVLRRARIVGRDRSERLHPSAVAVRGTAGAMPGDIARRGNPLSRSS